MSTQLQRLLPGLITNDDLWRLGLALRVLFWTWPVLWVLLAAAVVALAVAWWLYLAAVVSVAAVAVVRWVTFGYLLRGPFDAQPQRVRRCRDAEIVVFLGGGTILLGLAGMLFEQYRLPGILARLAYRVGDDETHQAARSLLRDQEGAESKVRGCMYAIVAIWVVLVVAALFLRGRVSAFWPMAAMVVTGLALAWNFLWNTGAVMIYLHRLTHHLAHASAEDVRTGPAPPDCQEDGAAD